MNLSLPNLKALTSVISSFTGNLQAWQDHKYNRKCNELVKVNDIKSSCKHGNFNLKIHIFLRYLQDIKLCEPALSTWPFIGDRRCIHSIISRHVKRSFPANVHDIKSHRCQGPLLLSMRRSLVLCYCCVTEALPLCFCYVVIVLLLCYWCVCNVLLSTVLLLCCYCVSVRFNSINVLLLLLCYYAYCCCVTMCLLLLCYYVFVTVVLLCSCYCCAYCCVTIVLLMSCGFVAAVLRTMVRPDQCCVHRRK